MRYVALIQKRDTFGDRHYSISQPSETKEDFVKRMKNCYINPYATPYWDVEIYELGEQIY